MAASEYWSDCGPARAVPYVISGAMYSSVPITASDSVSAGASSAVSSLLRPKSTIFGRISPCRSRARKMFAGLRSRCTMPRSCANASADATGMKTARAASMVSFFTRRRWAARSSPFSRSITR